ncbi:MAG: hypothetical protein FJZ01_19665 [Candidatus Sericytochromatia bacterium]|nr:hypothetical protein [Candidatus Tanganyikabacteria bacterium]
MRSSVVTRAVVLGTLLCVGACGTQPAAPPPAPTTRTLTFDFPAGQTSLAVRPIVDGPTVSRNLQTLYTRADIDVLVLQVFEVDPPTGIAQPLFDASGRRVEGELSGADLDGTVVFNNLKASTTYVVKAFAYLVSPGGTRQLISIDDSRSWATIPVGTEDSILVTLHVKLKDSGGLTGIGGLAISEGQYVASGDVFILVRNATPSANPTPGASGSPDPGPTPAPTPTPTPAASGSPAPEPSASPTPEPTPLPTPAEWSTRSIYFESPGAVTQFVTIAGAGLSIQPRTDYFLRFFQQTYNGQVRYVFHFGTTADPTSYGVTVINQWLSGATHALAGEGPGPLVIQLQGYVPVLGNTYYSEITVE